MALILKKMYLGYNYLFENLVDNRADGWFLMNSPFQPLACDLFYLYFVLKLGPQLMKNRPAFNIEKIMMIFNLAQVIVNSYIVYYAVLELLRVDWNCALVDYSENTLFVLKVSYIYFLTKVADLCDTVFFVLRKKENHISFLHVYHHFGMVLASWAAVRFFGGGHTIFMGCLNSFVHSVMYFYYLLSIWNNEYKKSIWWKKHITQLQILQFLLLLIIYGRLLFVPSCKYPKFVSYFLVPQNLFMVCLFGDFYWKAYIRPARLAKKKAVQQ